MLRRLEEFGKFIEITGFRNIKIENPKDFLKNVGLKVNDDLAIQLYNADLVATWQHLYFAAINALMAFKTRSNASKTLAVETVLYASGQRQIRKALDLIGLKSECNDIAILFIGENRESIISALSSISKYLGVASDDSVLHLTNKKRLIIRAAYGISDAELEAFSAVEIDKKLVDSVIERVALLSTKL